MGLTSLWNQSPEQLSDKHVQQIIAFAGSGKLQDGSATSKEFRDFLSIVPSNLLAKYAIEDCLSNKFDGSGLALQDIVNQIGRRLGFNVTDGRYRGTQGQIGFDGLWASSESHSIIVEVKTTDAYRIDLDTIAGYRRSLIKAGQVTEENSSILIVVGREDTGGLEAQVRGSRHAWDIRLISVDSLIRLMQLKEEVEDPNIAQKICSILMPKEFTKVDAIIDIVFSTAEEVLQENDSKQEVNGNTMDKPKFTPVHFNDACIKKIESHLRQTLIKRSRATFTSPDEKFAVICKVSREYSKSGLYYWYAFHPHQKLLLEGVKNSYVAFGCGSEENIILVPFDIFTKWLSGMNITEKDHRFYWHVIIFKENSKFVLYRKKEYTKIDLSQFVI